LAALSRRGSGVLGHGGADRGGLGTHRSIHRRSEPNDLAFLAARRGRSPLA
jgi:hypothetical protein